MENVCNHFVCEKRGIPLVFITYEGKHSKSQAKVTEISASTLSRVA
ncbi:MAG: hypothetical protein JSV77_09665 [Dehalococcoidales bacterium]|nr:MAG: hypothetical protein JSV77_09665 [Dehalococcoidales bacterium]